MTNTAPRRRWENKSTGWLTRMKCHSVILEVSSISDVLACLNPLHAFQMACEGIFDFPRIKKPGQGDVCVYRLGVQDFFNFKSILSHYFLSTLCDVRALISGVG